MTTILQPRGGSDCYFRLGMEYIYSKNQASTGLFYAQDNGPGNAQFLEIIYIPDGAKVYIKVDSTKYAMAQYDLHVRIHD